MSTTATTTRERMLDLLSRLSAHAALSGCADADPELRAIVADARYLLACEDEADDLAEDCPACGGSGGGEGALACPLCDGSGVRPELTPGAGASRTRRAHPHDRLDEARERASFDDDGPGF